MSLFDAIDYADLNSRQKENYNFQKVAGHLAGYGYNCIRLSDDWNGADFIACHIDGERFIKIQLKSRFTIQEKYKDRSIYIAFLDGEDCYVYPHDEVMTLALKDVGETASWRDSRSYTWGSLSKANAKLLSPYRV